MLSFTEILEGACGGVLLSILGTYLHSRRKGAEVLDANLHDTIIARDHTIESLTSTVANLQPPAVPKYELDARRRVRDLLAGAESDEIDVLRFLIDHGESLSDHVHANNNKGTVVGRALNRWRHKLIHVNVEHGTNKTFWSIAPGLREALIYVLQDGEA